MIFHTPVAQTQKYAASLTLSALRGTQTAPGVCVLKPSRMEMWLTGETGPVQGGGVWF